MKEAMLSFALRHKEPAALLIATSDQDYVTLMKLVMESGIQLMHVYVDSSTDKLIETTDEPMKWHELVNGDLLPENFSASNFDVPLSVPSPTHQDRPLTQANDPRRVTAYYDVGSCSVPPSNSFLNLRNNIDGLLPLVGFGNSSPRVQKVWLTSSIWLRRRERIKRR
ncbi:PREDICTED: uncharacterized protein LOC104711659 [Camelina sativa]|uniref:Uncharacterized protein LOC104711659 n=1 Tax=Camelina sativa TaxID=90675 RepID=A0ABM1QG26_CAMSA|nr:PREDICTED: uncharacterized protein LOC104711659 [Camelina sativa]